MLVKVGGMVVSMAVNIFLGRVLGPEGLGIINLSNQIIAFLLVFAIMGFEKVIIREVAIAYNQLDKKKVKDVLFTTNIISGGIGFILSLLLILFSEYISNVVFDMPALRIPLIAASAVFVPQIISRIISSALVGYKKIWQSNLVNQTLSLFVVGLVLLGMWIFNYTITLEKVAITYAVGRIAVTLVMTIYWYSLNKIKQDELKSKGGFIGKYMITKGLPLLMVSASLLLSTNADTLMLGWLSSAKEVGLYSTAAKIALLSSFLLQITVSTVAPKIAVLHENGERAKLELMIQRITMVLSFIGILTFLVFLFLGKPLLGIWGDEFESAYPALVILGFGQFINVATGPVGNILVMTNHEKIIRNITTFTVCLNIVLNYFLIREYGSEGAAIATSFTTILNMLICMYYVKVKIQIRMFRFL